SGQEIVRVVTYNSTQRKNLTSSILLILKNI
ncbi:MAG: hypothetical protein ACI9T9_001913, partial [Oleiphilaceae bacterium]